MTYTQLKHLFFIYIYKYKNLSVHSHSTDDFNSGASKHLFKFPPNALRVRTFPNFFLRWII